MDICRPSGIGRRVDEEVSKAEYTPLERVRGRVVADEEGGVGVVGLVPWCEVECVYRWPGCNGGCLW